MKKSFANLILAGTLCLTMTSCGGSSKKIQELEDSIARMNERMGTTEKTTDNSDQSQDESSYDSSTGSDDSYSS